jgi:hypothetical protein
MRRTSGVARVLCASTSTRSGQTSRQAIGRLSERNGSVRYTGSRGRGGVNECKSNDECGD